MPEPSLPPPMAANAAKVNITVLYWYDAAANFFRRIAFLSLASMLLIFTGTIIFDFCSRGASFLLVSTGSAFDNI